MNKDWITKQLYEGRLIGSSEMRILSLEVDLQKGKDAKFKEQDVLYNTEDRCGSKNGLQGRKIQKDTVNVVGVN